MHRIYLYIYAYIDIFSLYIYIYLDYVFIYLFMNAFIPNNHSAIKFQGRSLDSCLAVCEALILGDLGGHRSR